MTQAGVPKIRILLLDDHTLFRDGLSRLLDSEPDFEIAPNCSSVPEALEIVPKQPVDIVLLDHDLGEETGSDFLVRAREAGYSGRLLNADGRYEWNRFSRGSTKRRIRDIP